MTRPSEAPERLTPKQRAKAWAKGPDAARFVRAYRLGVEERTSPPKESEP